MMPCHRSTPFAGLLVASSEALYDPATHAGVLFSTFGPGNSYTAMGGLVVSGSSSSFTAFSDLTLF